MNSDALQLFGVVLASFVVFVWIPRIIFPIDRVPGTALDRVMAGVVLMAAYSCAAMYIFGSIGMLETVAIVASWVACWYVFKGRHREGKKVLSLVERGFAYSDRLERERMAVPGHEPPKSLDRRPRLRGESSGLERRFREWWEPMWESRPSNGDLVVRAGVVIVLLIAAWFRFSRAWSHVELVPQDSYLALSWTTFIGKGRLLADGIYPQGTYLCMSLIDRVYPGDVYSAVRFLGPLLNVFELVALYWCVSRITRNRPAGLLALSVFGLFAGHEDLLVVWPRQIGAMTNEFAIAFALVGIVYCAKYLTDRETMTMMLAAGALFMAITSNTLVLPLVIVGLLAVGVTALVTGAVAPLVRLAVACAIAGAAANYYMVLGFLQGNSFVLSFRIYQPGSETTFGEQAATTRDPLDLIRYNELYFLGFLGACIGVAVGLALWRRHQLGHGVVVLSITVAAGLLLNDLIGPELGLLFRTRMEWMAGALIPAGMGIGLGSVLAAVAGVRERQPAVTLVGSPSPRRPMPTAPSTVAIAGLVVVALAVVILLPKQEAIAREAEPSGYPQATDVSLDIIRNERMLEFTVVGVSEQYQEVLSAGFFVEAWVFARDISMTDAQDPDFELPIPTDRVYIFVEKETFPGPESPPVGPTEEYYRDLEKRGRMMQRIFTWAQLYRQVHDDMSVQYEDDELIVFKIDRNVDVGRANRSVLFKDYRWEPGVLFEDDDSITVDRIESNPDDGIVIEHA